jgi:plastocyanin
MGGIMARRGWLALAVFFLFTAATLQAAEPQKGVQKKVVATLGDDGVQHVEVLGGGYFFTPSHIVVKVNVPVELRVRKESGFVPHDLVLKAPEAGIKIEESLSSEPKSITFTPTKPGKYPFYCGKKLLFLPSHREKGMEGLLEVVE